MEKIGRVKRTDLIKVILPPIERRVDLQSKMQGRNLLMSDCHIAEKFELATKGNPI